MARPIKEGLDYFSLNVDFFNDDKIAFVHARFGEKGENYALKLLCKIYGDKGYFYQWGEDEAILFAKRVVGDASQHTFVNDVVHELVKRGFFNKDIFNRLKILTSNGIQKRYIGICKLSKRIYHIRKELEITTEESELPPEETPKIPEFSTHSKVKESKLNKSKVKEGTSEIISPKIIDFNPEEKFKIIFDDLFWKEQTCMHFSVDLIFFENYLKTFLAELKLKEDFHKEISEIKNHFINWFKIEIKKTTNANNSRNSTTAKVLTTGKRLTEGY